MAMDIHSRWIVVEGDVDEFNHSFGHMQGLCVGHVLHLLVFIQQLKHILHVNERLLDHSEISDRMNKWMKCVTVEKSRVVECFY